MYSNQCDPAISRYNQVCPRYVLLLTAFVTVSVFIRLLSHLMLVNRMPASE